MIICLSKYTFLDIKYAVANARIKIMIMDIKTILDFFAFSSSISLFLRRMSFFDSKPDSN